VSEEALVKARKPGRPRSLSPEARNALLSFLTNSLSRADGCKLLGISKQTLRNEMKRDPAFKLDVHRAELQGKLGAAACVTSAAQTDAKIAIEYLQRKWPDEWGKRTRVKIEGTPELKGGRAAAAELMAKLGTIDESRAPAEASPVTAATAPTSG
jgi:hypothetical protein